MLADVKGKGPAHPTGLNTPITTPLHPPLQRPNLNPPQYQTDRKVSFTDHQHPPQAITTSAAVTSVKPEPKPIDSEVDESFGFNSDDDAFFALADLGPPIDADGTDAGRPIDSDEGRPIDPDEGHFGGAAATTMVGGDVFDQHQHQQKIDSPVVSAPKLSRQEMIAAALSSAENKASSTSDSLQSHGNGDERQASGSGTETGIAPGMHSKMLLKANAGQHQRQNQNQNSGLNLTSLVQQRHQRHMAQRQDQNQNQIGSASSSTGEESKRPPISSIGGFHFPPGVVRSLI